MGKVFTGWRGLYPSRVYTPLIRVDPKEGLRVGLRITWVGGLRPSGLHQRKASNLRGWISLTSGNNKFFVGNPLPFSGKPSTREEASTLWGFDILQLN